MFKKGIWYSDLRELMIHCSSPDPTTFGGDVMVAQKIGLLRKSFRIFGDHDVLLNVSILLSFLVWSIAPLFGPLQLIPILDSLIRIYELVNF